MTNRHWLDWSRPCLPAAAQWLIARHAVDGTICDLRSVACVLPGRRAGRLLAELLVRAAEDRQLTLLPPRILTPANLVDLLIAPGQAIASRTECVLAWLEVLRAGETPARSLVLPSAPEPHDAIAWHDLAVAFCDVHDDLAGEDIGHERIVEEALRMDRHTEADRWRALQELHGRCMDTLRGAGRIERHLARRCSVDECAAGCGIHEITLIGVVEMNRAQRRVVGEFARYDRATALIHAPAERADWFDEHGCAVASRWAEARIDLEDAWIALAEGPDDQAQEVLRRLAAFEGRYAADEITIGLADESLAGRIRRAGAWAGLDIHSATGRALPRSAPWRLLEAVADWLETPRFATFAALLRHCDLERTVRRRCRDTGVGDWLSLLDRYSEKHLHDRFSAPWLGEEETQQRLAAVDTAVRKLLGRLTGDRVRPLGDWVHPVLRLLSGVYGWIETTDTASQPGDPGQQQRPYAAVSRETAEACVRLAEIIATFEQVDGALQPAVPAAAAVRLFLAHAADEELHEPPRSAQIEMVGWLELHLDLSPALIVAGFNEGAVPQAVLGDALLPNALRSALGMMDNDRRHARDAYLLEAMAASREALRLVVGRLDAVGEAIAPSRLLLACDDDALLRRALRFFAKEPVKEPAKEPVKESSTEPVHELSLPAAAPIGLGAAASRSMFVVPALPALLPPVQAMSVTDFKKYIDCPYRFALERLLRLQDRLDASMELDPLRFGSLAHDILRRFGEDQAMRDADDGDMIEQFLLAVMGEEARLLCGESPPPAVRVQLARLHQRLRGFAHLQAALRREGWRIMHCEWMLDEQHASLDIGDGAPMPIRGRIDRIDRHERSGAWRIIDYKTGEGGDNPYKVHHGNWRQPAAHDVEWKDLQLPLYRHLVRRSDLPVAGALEVGYLVLPRQAERARWHGASWSEQQLEGAIECARGIVRNVRAGRFERTLDFARRFDPFARICQTTVFGSDDDGGEDAP